MTEPSADTDSIRQQTLLDTSEIDLDLVERDLDGVEAALGRLDAGTYWTDEVSGGQIPDEVLADHPTARRV